MAFLAFLGAVASFLLLIITVLFLLICTIFYGVELVLLLLHFALAIPYHGTNILAKLLRCILPSPIVLIWHGLWGGIEDRIMAWRRFWTVSVEQRAQPLVDKHIKLARRLEKVHRRLARAIPGSQLDVDLHTKSCLLDDKAFAAEMELESVFRRYVPHNQYEEYCRRYSVTPKRV
ncbi:hypothetical protein JR316_0006199 [Psilocybe cubensis]|uniref:Uncharacterized protein n=2 Tax=Psilocybe cubensis TaxID=181762 RepID=A0A8H7XYU3_PSICU|nr:hypothetical protein JR316_0006199 [Psilocybe cubensis]KAH9481672.1 hypothetical protein JR316_0006199 [Psilocybe cubensis]